MSSKTVKLSNGMSFAEIQLCQEFFRLILRAKAVGVDLNPSESELVEVLYKDYCAATSWPISEKISGFTRGRESRFSNGREIFTECFVVRFVNGAERRFSFLKACSAIAKVAPLSHQSVVHQ